MDKKQGRPTLTKGKKVEYSRMAIEKDTYKRFLKIVERIKHSSPRTTNTQVLEAAMDALERVL